MALRFGRKHAELAGRWLPSVVTYGTGGTLAMLYFTDWKLVLQYVPFYNTKFQE